MREILFRGKRVDNGEWVQGYLSFHYVNGKNKDGFVYSGRSQIYVQSDCKNYDVITETVGQYTGLKDKNGKGIYEGDIIRFIKENCLVNFVENDCAFRIEVDGRISTSLKKAHSKDYEIIGNIHEEKEEEKCLQEI